MPSPRTIVIEGSDEWGYSATVPEVPGLVASGPTVDEAEQYIRLRMRAAGEKPGMVRVEISTSE